VIVETRGEEVYFEARLVVPNNLVDAVTDFIVQNIVTGLVLEEEENARNTVIIFYIPPELSDSYRSPLMAYLSGIHADIDWEQRITSKEIHNVKWENEYRKSIRPFKVAEDVLVRPPWAEPSESVVYEIIIEPKMAFGTGTHETTRSCLRVIREQFQKEQRFLDLGCGSGILSILADKLGAKFIKAVDYDPIAVDNCAENFAINTVRTTHEILLGSLEACDGDDAYDFIAANIIKSTLLPWLPRLVELTVPGGKLMLSGLLAEDLEEITAGLSDLSQTNCSVIPENAWRTVIVTVHE
jgi:ribosomal protein L11 methyltransferase